MVSTKLVFGGMAVLYLALMAHLFVINLPDWCAHPERPGNHLILGFCK